MFFSLLGCKDSKNKDFVFEEFKSQIEKEEMKIDSVDETGLIYISQGEAIIKISLDNVRKNFERDKDTTHISDLVKTLVDYSIELPSKWVDAKIIKLSTFSEYLKVAANLRAWRCGDISCYVSQSYLPFLSLLEIAQPRQRLCL